MPVELLLDAERPAKMERSGHSLVVVEDPLISKLVRAVLGKQGFAVVLAEPLRAKALLSGPETFNRILVTNSPAVFLEFAERVPLLYLSSSPDPELEAAFRHCRVVRKPFAPKELVEAVTALAAV